jgi:hypothetical protein
MDSIADPTVSTGAMLYSRSFVGNTQVPIVKYKGSKISHSHCCFVERQDERAIT